MARGKRRTIATGIYADRFGFEIVVKRGGKSYVQRARKDTKEAELLARRAKLLAHVLSTDTNAAPKGTLARDIGRYIAISKHLVGWQKQQSHLKAFVPKLGQKDRGAITRQDMLALRSDWAEHGVKPKTINNRLSALRAMYHALDGDDAPTPADRIKSLPSHRTPMQRIEPSLILEVDQELQRQEQRGWIKNAKTRARFRILASTGRRPSEVMRTEPGDIDLAGRVWRVRDGKGGFTPVGVPLTSEALTAWKLFIAADAWGNWNTNSFTRTLRRSGWPAGLRPYQMRHRIGNALSDADVDLADIGPILGHKHERTTRQHYVSPQFRRMQQAMRKIDGGLSWDRVPPGSATRKDVPIRVAQQKPVVTRTAKAALRFGESARYVRRK